LIPSLNVIYEPPLTIKTFGTAFDWIISILRLKWLQTLDNIWNRKCYWKYLNCLNSKTFKITMFKRINVLKNFIGMRVHVLQSIHSSSSYPTSNSATLAANEINSKTIIYSPVHAYVPCNSNNNNRNNSITPNYECHLSYCFERSHLRSFFLSSFLSL